MQDREVGDVYLAGLRLSCLVAWMGEADGEGECCAGGFEMQIG